MTCQELAPLDGTVAPHPHIVHLSLTKETRHHLHASIERRHLHRAPTNALEQLAHLGAQLLHANHSRRRRRSRSSTRDARRATFATLSRPRQQRREQRFIVTVDGVAGQDLAHGVRFDVRPGGVIEGVALRCVPNGAQTLAHQLRERCQSEQLAVDGQTTVAAEIGGQHFDAFQLQQWQTVVVGLLQDVEDIVDGEVDLFWLGDIEQMHYQGKQIYN